MYRASVPNKVVHNMLQVSRWFEWELILYKEILKNGYSFSNITLLIKRYCELFQWAFGSILIIRAMLWLITHSVYLPLGILLLALIIDIYLTDYFMSKNFFSTNKSKSLPYQNITFLLLRTVFDGIWPIIWIRRSIISQIFKKKTIFYKTPR